MLDKILTSRREELAREQQSIGLNELKQRCDNLEQPRSLAAALSGPNLGLIAEIKGSSPSKGHIRSFDDPAKIAKVYERAGAASISVLTEPNYFNGHIEFLRSVKDRVSIPVLRKDFIFDDYQIYQARAFGADAVLLMTAVVADDDRLDNLIDLAHRLGLEVLLESSDRRQLRRALGTRADVIGINNRDFYTLNINLSVSIELIGEINGNRPVVSESGIFTRDDVSNLEKVGFNGILVGTALMESNDIELKIKELMGRD